MDIYNVIRRKINSRVLLLILFCISNIIVNATAFNVRKCYSLFPNKNISYREMTSASTPIPFTDTLGKPKSDTIVMTSKHLTNGVALYSAGWDKIEAEWYMDAHMVEKGANKSGDEIKICYAGGYLYYPNIRDVKANTTILFYINPHLGGIIEVRNGSPTGKLLGSVDVPLEATKNYFTYECVLKNRAGIKNLYFVFKGEEGKNLFSIDWFKFQ